MHNLYHYNRDDSDGDFPGDFDEEEDLDADADRETPEGMEDDVFGENEEE
jgi:hypothetical protein